MFPIKTELNLMRPSESLMAFLASFEFESEDFLTTSVEAQIEDMDPMGLTVSRIYFITGFVISFRKIFRASFARDRFPAPTAAVNDDEAPRKQKQGSRETLFCWEFDTKSRLHNSEEEI